MSLVLIDTSVWARATEKAVGAAIADAIDANSVVITPAILLELLRSARSADELDELEGEYTMLHYVELTPQITKRARAVQKLLARRGYHRGPSPIDLLAAATAEAVGAELWHRDRDFELIAQATGQPQRRL
jgi:predicted nucleic acid-binding protein